MLEDAISSEELKEDYNTRHGLHSVVSESSEP
jgi:hypothetical protein